MAISWWVWGRGISGPMVMTSLDIQSLTSSLLMLSYSMAGRAGRPGQAHEYYSRGGRRVDSNERHPKGVTIAMWHTLWHTLCGTLWNILC